MRLMETRREAKITQFDMTIFVYKDVIWFDITAYGIVVNIKRTNDKDGKQCDGLTDG